MSVGTYLFGFVCEAMNEVSDEGSSLRVKLERSACPQCNLQGAGSRSCDVENVTETGRLSNRKKIYKRHKNKTKMGISMSGHQRELDYSFQFETRNTFEF